ncbi:universal stress protein [Natronomonas pharaonis]|nr:universal stress protein [Natronomonas pharaonis]
MPVATDEDAVETCAALQPHLDDVDRVIAAHAIEKAGGGIDKAPMGKREEDAREMLDIVDARLGDETDVRTEIVYGTDIVDALFDLAVETDSTSVVFVARKGGRLVRFLSGDTSMRLVTEAAVPVVALPREQ